jgi:putative tryptophan/tyrosine transport system substrate-binding protein
MSPGNGHTQEAGKTYCVGIIETGASDPTRIALWEQFKQRLRERGFVERQNISFEFRWAEGRQERLPDFASEFARLKVDVIVTAGTPAVVAASRATSNIPVVMAIGTLPTTGSEKGPQNIVGVIDAPSGLSARRLELLREVIPTASSFAILADHGNPSSPPAVQETQEAAKSLKMNVRDYWVRGPDDFRAILATMKADGIEGFVIAPGAMFFAQRRQIAALAIENRLPSLSVRADYAEAGILITYGALIRENYRQAAMHVDQILRGAKPSDLPVYEPTEFEFVINLKTAKALNLTIPPAPLARAHAISP